MIQGVAFDLGSTLLRFNGDMGEILKQSRLALVEHLLQQGIALDRGEFLDRFHQQQLEDHHQRQVDHLERPTATMLQTLLRDLGVPELSQTMLKEAMRCYYSISERTWQPVEGATQVLEQLTQSGFKLGLISNAGGGDNVQRLLETTGLKRWFDPVIISAQTLHRKPRREIFQRLLDAWDVPADSTVMVGDSLAEDILGAQAVGMHQIWVRQHAMHGLARSFVKPELIADTLLEVPQVVQELARREAP